jgi:hypothetical protein
MSRVIDSLSHCKRQFHLFAIAVGVCLSASALGDAGLVRAHTSDDHLTMTVFTSPTPIRVGLLDVSVLLQSTNDDSIRWGTINALLAPPDGNAMTVSLTRDAASTTFMQAAKFIVDQPGLWHITITARSDHDVLLAAFDVHVAPALPRLLDLWPWFLPVPIILTLWAIARRP